jgi:hypothetical protein
MELMRLSERGSANLTGLFRAVPDSHTVLAGVWRTERAS